MPPSPHCRCSARRLALAAAAATALLPITPAHALPVIQPTGPAGVRLPASPAGLSVETDLLPTWWPLGTCQSPAREVLRMAGRPEIRVGGNSQDRLWPAEPLPHGQYQVVDDRLLHAVRCVGATRSPVLLGLNLLGRTPEATGDILAAAGGLVPRDRLAITIGNEPNLYGSRLPDPGGYQGYLMLYGDTLAALRHRFESFLPPVAGPDAAAYRWAAEAARFVREVRPAQATAHLYGLNGCRDKPGTPNGPTVQRLLRPAASTELVHALSPIAAAARQIHVPAQLSETNTVACRGAAGVSDTFAAALWALGLLGDATSIGFRRVQFHTSVGHYDPFVVEPDGTVRFRPLWSAILLADALWPDGTRPLRVAGPLPTRLGAWAARRPDGGLAVLVVNRDLQRSGGLVLRTSAARGELGRLSARGQYAVALNGRRLVWSDGRPVWRGRQRVTRVRPRHGELRVRLAPGTAAWLVLGGRPGSRTPTTLTAGKRSPR
jgi:hypothetical protein